MRAGIKNRIARKTISPFQNPMLMPLFDKVSKLFTMRARERVPERAISPPLPPPPRPPRAAAPPPLPRRMNPQRACSRRKLQEDARRGDSGSKTATKRVSKRPISPPPSRMKPQRTSSRRKPHEDTKNGESSCSKHARRRASKRPRSPSPPPPSSRRRKPQQTSSTKTPKRNTLNGESSSSGSKKKPVFICEICIEPKMDTDIVSILGCTHAYCNDCIVKYVGSKLQENITIITCPVPECKGVLELEYCRSILPQEVFDKWDYALCEAMFIGSQKFYCPFKDCSAMLIDDRDREVIKEAECPNCWRLFCAQCKVPWHSEIGCEEFQKLHKDEREREDIMLMNLAQNKNWKRCPNCRIFVERTQGCKYVKCRCRTAFCYTCGSTNMDTKTHLCHSCHAIRNRPV